MRLIATTAQLAQGKDVFCDYLAEELNRLSDKFIWERGGFAQAVKSVFMDAFGVDSKFIEKWKRIQECPENFLMNVRKSLQFIGDGFRQIRDDIWIDIALRDESRCLCISDARYVNEAIAVRKKGGLNIVIYRTGFMNDDPNPSESQCLPIVKWCLETKQKDGAINFDVPISSYEKCGTDLETVSNYDIFIRNDGSIEDFYGKIDKYVIPLVLEKFPQ